MLVLKLEFWPGGDRRRAQELGKLLVANVGGDSDIADYRVIREDPSKYVTGSGWERMTGDVIGHERKRPVWQLVLKALLATVGRHVR